MKSPTIVMDMHNRLVLYSAVLCCAQSETLASTIYINPNFDHSIGCAYDMAAWDTKDRHGRGEIFGDDCEWIVVRLLQSKLEAEIRRCVYILAAESSRIPWYTPELTNVE